MELEEIFKEIADGKFHRLPLGSHRHEFWANKDASGAYNFVLRGEFSINSKKLRPTEKILIAFEAAGKESRLTLTLTDGDARSIFVNIVSDLLKYSQFYEHTSDQVMAEQLITRYDRWQEIFRKRKSEKLNQKQIVGLFGELSFLHDVASNIFGLPQAIFSWTGPNPDEQDFLFPNTLVEIKSTRQSKDAKIHISSENQLDISSGRIFLIYQTLSTGTGDNLNQLVEKIRTDPGHTAMSREVFEGKLIEAGFETLKDYDEPEYSIETRRIFEVSDDFPKLIKSEIPSSITRVSYDLDISALEDFETKLSDFKMELDNGS